MTGRAEIERRLNRAADAVERSCWASINDSTVRIAGTAAQLDELRDFYAPYYRLLDGAPADATAEILVWVCEGQRDSTAAITDMRVFLRASRPTIVDEHFTLFVRPVTGIEVVCDRATGRILLCGERATEVALQARTLVRDQIFRQLEKREGSVVFHASAIELGGVGVAFAGARNSGKTVSLLAFLSTRSANLVSCDRVKLCTDQDRATITMTGMPARCNIHRVTLKRDPFLRPLAHEASIRYDREGKTLVDAKSVVQLAGVAQIAAAPLGVVVLPEIVPGRASFSFERVDDRDEVRRLMRANVMEGSRKDRHVHWLGWVPDPPTTLAERIEGALDGLAERVKVVRVRAGYESYVKAIEDGSFDPLAVV